MFWFTGGEIRYREGGTTLKIVSALGQNAAVGKGAAYVNRVLDLLLGFLGWIVLIAGVTVVGVVGRIVEISYNYLKPPPKLNE